MWGGGFLTEQGKILLLTPPVDTTGAAISSLWFNMKTFQRATIVIVYGAESSITPPAVTLNQATSNAGAGSKALSFDWKVSSDGVATSQSNDAYTRTAVSSDTFTLPAVVNQIYMINLRDTQLDIANGFTHVQVAVASPGAHAMPIAILAILYDGDFACAENEMPSAVA